MIGHPQGASGAAGVVDRPRWRCARGVLPPTINLQRPRPRLRSRLHPQREPSGAEVEAALCNCLGFGSKNSAIVLGAAES